MPFLYIFAFLLMAVVPLRAQELDMTVIVVAPNNLTGTDKSMFPRMELAIKELVNNQKWTNDAFEPNEKIKCKFQLNVKSDQGNNTFTCDLLVEATRPVFGSSYETKLISISEKDIPIIYDPTRQLENCKDNFTDNLSALVTFYAYFILAMDYDSFALEGGDPFIAILQNMVNSLPGQARSLDESWSPGSKKKNSRFFLLDNLNHVRMKPFRRAIYEYHRISLDGFSKNVESARAEMVNSVEVIASTDQSFPNTFLLQSFIAAKRSELIEIFKQGTSAEKARIIASMSSIDPANSSIYNSIKS
ncbi:MAG: DUF4835 family protein [Saprospiraceae bacterium]|nr:DUF4835 family protein [Saprospiraceae bacterium]